MSSDAWLNFSGSRGHGTSAAEARRLALLAVVVVGAALTVGYASAGGGYQARAVAAPTPLLPVRSASASSGSVPSLASVAVTQHLRPVTVSSPPSRTTSVRRSAPVIAPSQPLVVQPTVVRHTTIVRHPTTPSSGGSTTFDSSG